MNNKETIMAFICLIIVIAGFIFCANSIANKNRQIEALENRIETVEKQRDILSDALRYSNDCFDDNNIVGYTEYYLQLINCNLDSLYRWSYCY
jgi:uncharacterized membrane protein YvbJ